MKSKKVFKKIQMIALVIISNLMMFPSKVYAGSIEGSKAVTGTTALISDIQRAFLVISPALTVVILIFLQVKKQGAEETEEPVIKKRMKSVLIGGISVFLISSLVGIVLSYYK